MNGIIMDLIGQKSQNILSSVSAWSPMKNKNIDAWKINLARGLVKFRENEFNSSMYVVQAVNTFSLYSTDEIPIEG